jgi:hypothetical protein
MCISRKTPFDMIYHGCWCACLCVCGVCIEVIFWQIWVHFFSKKTGAAAASPSPFFEKTKQNPSRAGAPPDWEILANSRQSMDHLDELREHMRRLRELQQYRTVRVTLAGLFALAFKSNLLLRHGPLRNIPRSSTSCAHYHYNRVTRSMYRFAAWPTCRGS